MRGRISEKSAQEIEEKVPQIDRNWVAETFPYNFVFSDIENKTEIHISLICLSDAIDRWQTARIALIECYSHIVWYRKESVKFPEEHLAVLFGKFYADYISLLLYAIGEDISEFVLRFMEVSDDYKIWIQNEKKKTTYKKIGSSNLKKVKKYLNKHHQKHTITKLINSLCNNNSWKETLHYRNVWVHQKPPIVRSNSIKFDRKSLIWKKDGGVGVNFGGGSEARYSIDELVNLVQESVSICRNVINQLVEIVAEKRSSLPPSVW